MGYVVVFNRNGPIPLRHVVTIREPYNQNEFARWYYKEYRELDGDEFIHCPTHEQMIMCLKEAEKE